MFAPPAGKSSWGHGVVPFSQHQVRFPRNARPPLPLPAPTVLLGVLPLQAAWEYAKTGFRHGPLGLWRDELLVKQMVPLPPPSSHLILPLLSRPLLQETWDLNHTVLFSMTLVNFEALLEYLSVLSQDSIDDATQLLMLECLQTFVPHTSPLSGENYNLKPFNEFAKSRGYKLFQSQQALDLHCKTANL